MAPRKLLSLLCGALMAASSFGNPVLGATATSNFTVSVTITAGCSISAGALAFGSTAGPLAANIDQSSTITVNCTNTTPYSVGLSNGANASGSQRRMASGGNFVNYDLYTDAGRTTPFTTGSTSTTCTTINQCALGTGTGSNQSITVYGRIPPQTTPAPATYTDTVTATITY